MHEWALADGIVRTAIEFARQHGKEKVLALRIVLGELQDVNQEILEFAINEIKRGTIAEGAELEFVIEEAEFKCRNCETEWKLKDVKSGFDERIKEDIHFIPEVVHAFLACPKCGSRDFEVTKGRGVYLAAIKVEGDEE
ncbi:hydrogenase nickel incorporation protein HypA [Thermococcus argininiproducens]|uniref:Hydrogenase maturation factor HypA n=1 Tax=Thermococcus argininiproducens TaxID=2866384 RepID=A0A9E7SC42_9EURY|nr:hydrogenase nickel incorporation protein HypA [Thermococcus argininiproducens]USG99484.1 hydrogenase nickel incorporation protein HypA [Thermococcus argininiproducens]